MAPETWQGYLNTWFSWRENWSWHRKNNQITIIIKNCNNGLRKNYSVSKPHAVLLASELCERDRTVSRDVVWNWKSCLHRAIFQVPCLKAAPILNFISPAPKYWAHWPVSTCCVDTETEVLKNLAHAIVWIPKQTCICQKTAQATGDLNNQSHFRKAQAHCTFYFFQKVKYFLVGAKASTSLS